MTATCSNCSTTFDHVERDEDGVPELEAVRCGHPGCAVRLCKGGCDHLSFVCEGCNALFCNEHRAAVDGWPSCLACAIAAVESEEPECTCTQTDVDMFNPFTCEYHNDRSRWNARLRAVTAVQQYEDMGAA
jgi:hypothetical protein